MSIPQAIIAIAILLGLTLVAGVVVSLRSPRARRMKGGAEVIEPERLGAEALGARATLLQFSTEMCARCPGVHRTLADVASTHTGVSHLDIDLTHRPDIAKHFHVLQTPTTLILDGDGVIQTRFGGIPRRDVIELELARVTGEVEPERV